MDVTVQNSDQNQAQVPAQPISVPQKEAGPGMSIAPSLEENYVQKSDAELHIPSEVAEHGVEAVVDHETLQLTEDHKQVGLEPAKESVPVSTQPSGAVQFSLTTQQATQILKMHKKVSDSILWLAKIGRAHV